MSETFNGSVPCKATIWRLGPLFISGSKTPNAKHSTIGIAFEARHLNCGLSLTVHWGRNRSEHALAQTL
jgi:hypothetical protein